MDPLRSQRYSLLSKTSNETRDRQDSVLDWPRLGVVPDHPLLDGVSAHLLLVVVNDHIGLLVLVILGPMRTASLAGHSPGFH